MLDGSKIGSVAFEGAVRVDADAVARYAAATNDAAPAYARGEAIPPAYPAVLAWQAMQTAMADFVPAELQRRVVHGERDHLFHAPVRPGDELTVRATHFALRGGGAARYTVRLDLLKDGAVAVEQYATMVIVGVKDAASAGPDKPDHTYEPTAGAALVRHVVATDADQTYRYRDASGDTMPIHVDEAIAKKAGLPGIILHGVCTMAFAGHAAATALAGSDPARLRRLSVRWAKYALPGAPIAFAFEQLDAGRYGFVGESDGAAVITNGRVELV